MIVALLAAAALAPPLDRPFRYVTTETRSDGRTERRLTVERRVTFGRDERGLFADVLLFRTDAKAEPAYARRFNAGLSGLKGRTVRYRLDSSGRVTAVDDEDAVWAAMVAGIARIGAGSRSPAAAGVALPFTTLPPERRRAVLASTLSAVFAGDVAAPGTRAVTVPGYALRPGTAPLSGRESVSRDSDGSLRVALDASAVGDAGASTTLRRSRHLDPATGLVLETRDEVRVTVAGGAALTVTEVTLTPDR